MATPKRVCPNYYGVSDNIRPQMVMARPLLDNNDSNSIGLRRVSQYNAEDQTDEDKLLYGFHENLLPAL